MNYSISTTDISNLPSFWATLSQKTKNVPIFVTPEWLCVWWQVFGTGDLLLYIIRKDSEIIGIAPLRVKEGTASFIGNASICDYLDFIISPDANKKDFFSILLGEIKTTGIKCLSLEALRPDSTAFRNFIPIARSRQYQVSYQKSGVSVEMNLPWTWHGYLSSLSAKQRHEVNRKLRRLEELGNVNFHTMRLLEDASDRLGVFIKMFRESRQDKANFMTDRMQTFFKLLVESLTGSDLLKFGFLELSSLPVAAVMYFDYNNNIYLYNSGYDPHYRNYSVGIISKILCIKESIEQKRGKFDFLRGAEVYKYHLGGTEMPLYKCTLILN